MPRVGFDEHMPARQLTLAQVGGILEFAPAQPVTGKKRVHVSDNTRNGRRAPALAARPPRGRATAAHGRNGQHARYGREPNGPRPTVIPSHTAGGAP